MLTSPLHFQQKFWNKIAYTKESTTSLDMELLQRLAPNKEIAIIDIGCGYGRILNILYQHGYKNLAGIDISQKMIQRGKEEFPFLNLIYATDFTKVIAPNSYAVAIVCGVLTCIAKEQLQVNLINNIHQWLAPHGLIYVNDFLINSDLRNCERYNKLQLRHPQYPYGTFEIEEDVLFKHHSPQWVETLLTPFQQVYYQTKKFNTLNNHSGNGFTFIGKK